MKYLFAIIAFLIFLKPIIPVVEYVVNYNYISKVLCENKAKPQLKCNGKCHLMKELAKEAESQKPSSNDKKTTTVQEVEVLFCNEIKPFIVRQIYFQDTILATDNYVNLYFHLTSCAVFHPPTYA